MGGGGGGTGSPVTINKNKQKKLSLFKNILKDNKIKIKNKYK